MGILPAVIVLVVGCCLVAVMVKTRWPGWIGLPFVVIVLTVIRDLGTTPIAALFVERYFINPMVGVAAYGEVSAAALLILLNAFAIAAGMVLLIFAKNLLPHSGKPALSASYPPHICSKAWRASFFMFLFGVLCQAVVFFFLLREVNLLDFAKTRALFSVEATTIPLYSYARLLSAAMTIGVWGMMLFAEKNKYRTIISVVGIISVVLLEVLFGGRMKVVATVLGIALIYHYGIKRIKLRRAILFAMVALIGLVVVHLSRLQVSDIRTGAMRLSTDVLMSTSVDETAFALRHFPENAPFMGIGVISGGISHLFPTIGRYMVWNKNTWDVIVKYIRGGHRGYSGISGEHYVPPAEHYMQFGVRGVVGLGIIYGFFYGMIFSWYQRHRENKFILMVAVYAYVGFFISIINGKMISWIGGMGFGALLPICLLVVATFRLRREVSVLGVLLSFCVLSFFAKRLLFPKLFDYVFAAALVAAYLAALKFMGKEKRVNLMRSVTKKRLTVISYRENL
jgi:oligosaccharide repeat unit polymerase